VEEVSFETFVKDRERKRWCRRVISRWNTHVGWQFVPYRKGAVKVKDLLVISREEGLDGRVRETAEEDLVFTLFCTERRFRK
jgi:hypothetical protein